MRIGICDDEIFYRLETKKYILEYFKEKNSYIELLEFSSGYELLDYQDEIHILFLDIEMKGIDGIGVKEELNKNKINTMIIFLTNHIEYMENAFGSRVYGFLTKPIVRDKFFKIMDKAMRNVNSTFIVDLNTNDNEQYIRGEKILYIQSEDKYSKVITGDREYLIRRSLNEWNAILEKHDFYRVHKSYIVNLAYVHKISEYIVMENNYRIKLSRRNSKEFRETYFSYIKRKANE